MRRRAGTVRPRPSARRRRTARAQGRQPAFARRLRGVYISFKILVMGMLSTLIVLSTRTVQSSFVSLALRIDEEIRAEEQKEQRAKTEAEQKSALEAANSMRDAITPDVASHAESHGTVSHQDLDTAGMTTLRAVNAVAIGRPAAVTEATCRVWSYGCRERCE